MTSDDNEDVKGSGNSFLFSLTNQNVFTKQRSKHQTKEVRHNKSYILWFGKGLSDLYISNDCNVNSESSSNLGYNY